MPTGYTCDIQKGASFEEFIMQCSRQFGALIMMRDMPNDAEIPERFEPSKYHADKIDEIKNRLDEIRNMSFEEADKSAKDEYKKRLQEIKNSIEERNSIYQKYTEMLIKVKKWTPPTDDHICLKDFMIDQINQSIKFDCDTKYYEDQSPVLLSAEDWVFEQKKKLWKDLKYHNEKNIEEIERTESRNKWLSELRKSISKQEDKCTN